MYRKRHYHRVTVQDGHPPRDTVEETDVEMLAHVFLFKLNVWNRLAARHSLPGLFFHYYADDEETV